MATFVVTGDQYRTIDQRMREIKRQLDQDGGSPFDPELVADALQRIVEGKFKTEKWLEESLVKEKQYHQAFFGQEFDLTEFQETLQKYGQAKIQEWQKLGLEPHFLPEVSMAQGASFPGWKVKPEDWYYQNVANGKILRQQPDDKLVVDKEAYKLEGMTVLIDARRKPSYTGGTQVYENDNLLGEIILELRQKGEIADYQTGPRNSRFNVSANEWEKEIKPALAGFLGLKVSQLRLERVVEANVIPQLYPDIPRKDDGSTNTWTWYEEFFGDRDSRLLGGHSGNGGLANVYYDLADDHWRNRSFRPLAVL